MQCLHLEWETHGLQLGGHTGLLMLWPAYLPSKFHVRLIKLTRNILFQMRKF